MKKRIFFTAALITAVLILTAGFLMWRHVRPAPKRYIMPKKAAVKRVVAAKTALPAIAKKFSSPVVAIVMDDFGYSVDDMDEFFALKEPVTLSILPNLQFSKKIALMARSNGYEFILHLPLEPKNKAVKEEFDTIKSSMPQSNVISMLDQEIASVPGVSGASNHMGSKSTEDKTLMTVILKDLKGKGLYFFDSLTSEKSVCASLAHDIGLRYAKRDVFLDIPNDEPNIKKQIMELRKLAFRKGRAIGVCHYRKNTIKVLRQMLPSLSDEGIRFVYVSELTN